MEYPRWVEEPADQSDKAKRVKCLQFLIRRAGIMHVDGTGSIAPIAAACGINGGSMAAYIARGRFPKPSALLIERTFGRELTPYEVLIDPLGDEQPQKTFVG